MAVSSKYQVHFSEVQKKKEPRMMFFLGRRDCPYSTNCRSATEAAAAVRCLARVQIAEGMTSLRERKRNSRRNLALVALLLLDGVKVGQPFGVGGLDSNLRLWTTTPRRTRTQPPSPFPVAAAAVAAAAGSDGRDHGDVITGSNQLEGWKTNTAAGAAGAAGAPRRSNVMGRRRVPADEPDADSGGSSRDKAGPAPPPILERDGGGEVHRDAEEGANGEVSTWRAEAATTSAELMVSLKVRKGGRFMYLHIILPCIAVHIDHCCRSTTYIHTCCTTMVSHSDVDY